MSGHWPAATPDQPQLFGPYRVRRALSAGGMGLVYEGEHVETGQRVAIKTVSLVRGATLAGIRAEVFALATLGHPGVARILDQGVADGSPWYAMELLIGETLAEVRDRLWAWRRSDDVSTLILPGGTAAATTAVRLDALAATGASAARAPAPPTAATGGQPAAAGGHLADVLLLALRLCAPLAHVHGRGLVHRDLKPENVIVTGRRPVLVDFGLVTRFPGPLGKEVLGAGVLAGTLAYMPPEQIRHHPVDARADLYALGCMLHELVTGQRPFTATEPDLLVEQHLHEPPIPVSYLVSGVPAALDELILQLLSKQPRDRFGHARDVAAMLARALYQLADPAVAPDQIAQALAEVPATSYLYRPEMVSRQRPLQLLTEQLDRAARGTGVGCLLGGESGVGKTMLASELARLAGLKQLRVVTAQCLAFHQPSPTGAVANDVVDVPLHPFRPLLQAVADHCRELGPATSQRVLGSHARLLAFLEPSLVQLAEHSQPTRPGRSGQGGDRPDADVFALGTEPARARLLAALTQVLIAFARERPVALIVDDVQWADELSLAFLQSLSAAALADLPLFLLATYRSEEVSRPMQQLLVGWDGQRVKLDRLDDEGVSQMVAEMLGLVQAPSALSRFLARTCAGNPFFVTEYVRAAVSEALLSRQDGRWRLAVAERDSELAYQALSLPDSLDGLIRQRLAHLTAPATRAAEVAAVIGRQVDERLMAAVVDHDPANVAALSAELVDRHILELTPGGPLRFGHDKVRELTYATIEPARRQQIHARVGAALEQLGEAGPYLLAHHFRAAGDPTKAFQYGYAAGQDALAAGAYHEAHEQLTATLRLVETSGAGLPASGLAGSPLALARLLRLTAEAATAVGDLQRSEQLLSRAHALVSRRLPRRPGGWLALLLGQALRQLWQRVLPARWVRAPQARQASLQESARITGRLGFSYMFLNMPTPMLAILTLNANVAEAAEVPSLLAVPYSIFGTFLGLMGAGRAAHWYFTRARAAAQRGGDLNELFHQAQIEGFFYINRAAWGPARQVLEPQLARTQQLGVGYEGEAFRLALANMDIFTGQLPAAERHLEAVAASARPLANRLHEWWGRKYEAVCLIHRGYLRQALDVVAPAEQGFRERGNVVDWLGVMALTAVAHARLGELDQALARADEAGQIASRNPAALYHTYELHYFMPEVCLAAWRSQQQASRPDRQAAAAARSQIAISRRFARAFPIGIPVVLRHRAQQAQLEGRPGRALALLRSAISRAQQLGMPLEEAFAQLDLATLPGLPDSERPQALDRAAALLSALGCAWHLTRAAAPDGRR